jgi:hypothetical protein
MLLILGINVIDCDASTLFQIRRASRNGVGTIDRVRMRLCSQHKNYMRWQNKGGFSNTYFSLRVC